MLLVFKGCQSLAQLMQGADAWHCLGGLKSEEALSAWHCDTLHGPAHKSHACSPLWTYWSPSWGTEDYSELEGSLASAYVGPKMESLKASCLSPTGQVETLHVGLAETLRWMLHFNDSYKKMSSLNWDKTYSKTCLSFGTLNKCAVVLRCQWLHFITLRHPQAGLREPWSDLS